MRWRVGFVLGVAALACVPAGADSLQDFARCAQITSNDLRLICYDTAARGLSATPPAEPAPPAPQAEAPAPQPSAAPVAAPTPAAAAAADQVPAPKKKSKGWFGIFGGGKEAAPVEAAAQTSPQARTPESEFGANRLPRSGSEDSSRPKAISSIRSPITDYAFTPLGRIIVFLENGQVWRQIDGDTKKLRLRKGRSYTAEIEKGVLGSFDLSVDGVDGFVKVTRIK